WRPSGMDGLPPNPRPRATKGEGSSDIYPKSPLCLDPRTTAAFHCTGRSCGRRPPMSAQVGRKPALRVFHRHGPAPRVVLELVTPDLADGKVLRLRVGQVKTAHR